MSSSESHGPVLEERVIDLNDVAGRTARRRDDEASKIEQARETLAELKDRMRKSETAAMSTDVLEAAAVLRNADPQAVAAARALVLESAVNTNEWDRQVGRRAKRRAKKAAQIQPASPDDVVFTHGNVSYRFGAGLCFARVAREGEEPATHVFASDIWPLQVYENVEPDAKGAREHGVRLRYKSSEGATEHHLVPAGAFVTKRLGSHASAEAASQGVQVRAGSDHWFAHALGAWRDAEERQTVKLVARPGWHSEVYVNGANVVGAGEWRADPRDARIIHRSGRAGRIEEYIELVVSELATPTLRLAFGLSLAGALVERIGIQPFSVHIHGPSSAGKSSAALVAASVWGHPDELAQSWNTTTNGFEVLAETANGACLVLDEIQKWRYGSERLGHAIHDINSAQGRVRLKSTGERSEQRTWRLTALSTGEVSIADRIGDDFQGGHGVRGIDLPVELGDVTKDAAHAGRLYENVRAAHGVAGDRWVAHLVEADTVALRETWSAWQRHLVACEYDGRTLEGAEEVRIVSNLALIAVALEGARATGLAPWSNELISADLRWAIGTVLRSRARATTPNERALALLWKWFDVHPVRFPNEGDDARASDVIGYRRRHLGAFELWTSESMLKGSGLPVQAGISVRSWVTWCVDHGHARKEANARCAEKQRNWVVFRSNEEPVLEELF